MNKVQRSEIIDYVTYEENREAERQRVMQIKAPRRVHIGEYLTFLFENTETIRYQIQEILRAERIVREKDIQHEIDVYNELLGDDGELACCLLIEVDDKAERDSKLRQWLGLQANVYAKLPNGKKVMATYDQRQVDTEKLSSVQYLKLNVEGKVPLSIGVEHPQMTMELDLNDEQRRAFAEDLGTTP
jgi:hypothetical protein